MIGALFSYNIATLSGMLQDEFDGSIACPENIRAGKSVTFLCDGLNKTITRESAGNHFHQTKPIIISLLEAVPWFRK